MRVQEIPLTDGKLIVGFTISNVDESVGYTGELEIDAITFQSEDLKTNIDVMHMLENIDDLVGGNMIMSRLERECWDSEADDINPMED